MAIVIPKQNITEEFAKCWQAAGTHLSKQTDAPLSWIKASLNGLLMEHFSFRLGNQIFFVQLEDVDGNLDYPGQRQAFLNKAESWKGHPCVMPMKNVTGEWKPILPNWGLQHAITNQLLIPPALITDEPFELTDYELQDLAVQIVRDSLKEAGKEVTESQSDPLVHPSIWFVDDNKLSWVVVGAVRYPAKHANKPENINGIAAQMFEAGYTGYFASVSVASANDPFDPNAINSGNYLPLIRGEGYMISYKGLEPVAVEE